MLHAGNIPEGMIITPRTFETDGQTVKPFFGALGKQYVEFREHLIYSGSASKAEGREVRTPVEMCLIRNDKFSTAAIRVKDLSQRQKIELAGLYKQFKEQKDSTDKRITDWDVVNDNEKALLIQSGVHTVEQLASFKEHELYQLGPAGKDFHERAQRFMKSKEDTVKAVESDAVKNLVEEVAKLKADLAAKEEAYYAKQTQIAEEEGPAKRRQSKPEQTTTQV